MNRLISILVAPIPRRIWLPFLAFIALFILCAAAIDRYVWYSGSNFIIAADKLPAVDAIIVPGAHVYADGSVSWILQDRLDGALESYRRRASSRLLVSGDHGQNRYDEVNTMKDFLMSRGISADIVFMDHAGFSTYDTLYRSRDIFRIKRAVISTQAYHLPRALFTARALGIEAWGVPSDRRRYAGMTWYRIREIPARIKAFLYVSVLKPEPRFLGEEIPITGSGEATDDGKSRLRSRK